MTYSTALAVLQSALQAGHIKEFTQTVTESGQTVYYFIKADGSHDCIACIS